MIPPVSWASPSPILYGTALSATQLDATTSVPGIFDYSPSLGAVLPAGSQALSVTFTPTDTATYATVTASVSLTVQPLASPAITWSTPAAITYGTLLTAAQLNASDSIPGTFAYSPALGAVIPAGSQTLSVTFTPTDPNHAVVNAIVTITVNQATPVLNWSTPAAITYGTALSAFQLNATSSVPGTYIYAPSSGTQFTAGSHLLSVIFTPTDSGDYTTATASVTITVLQATPRIRWSPTALLAVGSPLGSGQLNATVTMSGGTTPLGGSFVYTPPAGTIFNSPGPQNLLVTFTPYDTTDYTTAQASITMTASVFGIAAWGDSLTCGCSGTFDQGPYPSELQKLITLPVVNLGVSGNTSTQIGVREGGVPAVVSVAGGVIPTSGGVTVTFPTCSASNCPTYIPVTPYGPPGGVSGTIQGVHGTITIDSTGTVLTFTPTTLPVNPVNVFGTPQFVVDTPYANYIPVFWEGRNDFMWTNQILSDLANQVATVPAGQDYVVLSIINENRSIEWYGVSGNSLYQWLIPFNEQLGSIYGSHYIDIRKLLVDAYDPTDATDVTDYQHDEVPSSLRAVDQKATLAYSIGPSDTSITLTKASHIPGATSIVKIDSGASAENVLVTSASGNTMIVTRGFAGNQTSHSAGVPVVQDDIVHLNAQGHQVVANALAKYFSAYAK